MSALYPPPFWARSYSALLLRRGLARKTLNLCRYLVFFINQTGWAVIECCGICCEGEALKWNNTRDIFLKKRPFLVFLSCPFPFDEMCTPSVQGLFSARSILCAYNPFIALPFVYWLCLQRSHMLRTILLS